MPYSKVVNDASISLLPFWNLWKILLFKTNFFRIRAVEDPIWRCAMMHWRGKLQTTQFTTHNKLCFDKILFHMHYKLHARQKFWIASTRMTKAQSPCVLQQSKKLSWILLRGRRRVHFFKEHLQIPKILLDWNHARCWHLSKYDGQILLPLYNVLLKVVHLLITCMVQCQV